MATEKIVVGLDLPIKRKDISINEMSILKIDGKIHRIGGSFAVNFAWQLGETDYFYGRFDFTCIDNLMAKEYNFPPSSKKLIRLFFEVLQLQKEEAQQEHKGNPEKIEFIENNYRVALEPFEELIEYFEKSELENEQ